MNTAIGTNTVRTPHMLRKHYLLILGGIVVLTTIVVIAAMVAVGDSGGKGAAAPEPAAAIQPFTRPVMTVFLVNSEAEAQALVERETAYAAERELEGLETKWTYQVLVAGTQSDESIALSTLAEIRSRWQRAGASGLEVIDLR